MTRANYDNGGFESTSSRRSSKAEVSELKSRSKALAEDPFRRYMKKNYIEHFRRMMSWRRAARWVLLTYPLTTSVLFSAPFVITIVVTKRLYELKPDWFVNFLSPESQSFVMPILYGIATIAAVLGLLTGIGLGISRARLLTFEAERTELAVRQSYFLNRISRSQRRKATKRMSI